LDDRQDFTVTCAILAELSPVPSTKIMACTRGRIKEMARKLRSKENISAAKKKVSQKAMMAAPQTVGHQREMVGRSEQLLAPFEFVLHEKETITLKFGVRNGCNVLELFHSAISINSYDFLHYYA
jgi:hypothetical protein